MEVLSIRNNYSLDGRGGDTGTVVLVLKMDHVREHILQQSFPFFQEFLMTMYPISI